MGQWFKEGDALIGAGADVAGGVWEVGGTAVDPLGLLPGRQGIDAGATAGTVGTALADIPADFINAATGTGENLGWFGVADRHFDPRLIAPDEEAARQGDYDGWVADPTDENTGLSGFWQGAGGAGGEAAERGAGVAADATTFGLKALLKEPIFLLLFGAAVFYFLGGPALLVEAVSA